MLHDDGTRPTRLARAATALLGAVVLPVVLALPAAADAPVRVVISDVVVTPVDDLCPFPIVVTSTFEETVVTTFTDRSGQITRISLHFFEQDEFTNPANDRTLVGLPYRVNSRLLFEDGELVSGYSSGVTARVPLPDGDVFLAAGRVEFIQSGATFVLVPDTGTPVDPAALCDALS